MSSNDSPAPQYVELLVSDSMYNVIIDNNVQVGTYAYFDKLSKLFYCISYKVMSNDNFWIVPNRANILNCLPQKKFKV